MNQMDIDFFETYKRLDKLCRDIFNCNNGISEYIAQMEKSTKGDYLVPSWKSDYKNLKHIRWIRNQIAHEDSDYPISNRADCEFAESFYARIMHMDDPFSRLRKIEQERIRKNTYKKPTSIHSNIDSKPVQSRHKQRKNKLSVVLLSFIILIGFLLILFFIFGMHIIFSEILDMFPRWG